jgi:hypothetical protein
MAQKTFRANGVPWSNEMQAAIARQIAPIDPHARPVARKSRPIDRCGAWAALVHRKIP